jgi:hypothetical protein
MHCSLGGGGGGVLDSTTTNKKGDKWIKRISNGADACIVLYCVHALISSV